MQLKSSKKIFAGSLASALILTFAVISPVLAQVQQNMVAQANCASFQYSAGTEPTIITDTETGTVNISFTDANGAEKQTQLNFKGNKGFAGCSSQAKRILTDIKAQQAKYNSDICNEVTDVVNGKRGMLAMDGKSPSMDDAKVFQKHICAMAAEQ